MYSHLRALNNLLRTESLLLQGLIHPKKIDLHVSVKRYVYTKFPNINIINVYITTIIIYQIILVH